MVISLNDVFAFFGDKNLSILIYKANIDNIEPMKVLYLIIKESHHNYFTGSGLVIWAFERFVIEVLAIYYQLRANTLPIAENPISSIT